MPDTPHDSRGSAAAERIFAAADQDGHARQEVRIVAQAVYAIRAGGVTSVALVDSAQVRRRLLAHIIGKEMYAPGADPAAIYQAVVGQPPPQRAPAG